MWVHGKVGTTECPVSSVTPLSVEWVEKYLLWGRTAEAYHLELPARDAEAFLVLGGEERESGDGIDRGN